MESERKPASLLVRLLLIMGLGLVANAAYIAASGSANIFYVANDLLHPFLGILVAILGATYMIRRRNRFSGVTGLAAVLVLALATGFGGYLAIVGMTRPHRGALYAHVSLAIAGLFFLIAHLRPRAGVGNRESETGTGGAGVGNGESGIGKEEGPISHSPLPTPSRRAWRWCLAVMLASACFYGVAAVYQHYFPNATRTIHNPPTAPLSMEQEGAGAASFMFPSSARTPDGQPIESGFFMNSESCRRCHEDIYEQWQSSMHHFASFNNQWYRKSIEYMQDTIGIKSSLWCGGCHDHALIIAGKMQKYPIRDIEMTPAGQNGLGCMSCHAIVHVDSTMGQGGITFEYPRLAELAESRNPVLRWLHDYDVKLDPKPHRNAFLKPFHRDPRQAPGFCSACHKVHLDVPVNHYRWIRGFDDYDNWQASGVSGLGARSFYYPPTPSTCVDCHMPLLPSNDFGNVKGFVHSHRFAAANTAVPASHGDGTQVEEVERFLKGALSVDIFALAEEPATGADLEKRVNPPAETPQLASTFAVGEESSAGLDGPVVAAAPPARLMAPLGRADAKLHRGETARVEVVVRTRRLGHFFPGGTVDAFDCWLELEARDSEGRIIFWSGEVADKGQGPVDPGAHFYKSLQLDAHGNVINKRNAWSTRATMYAHLIPPGAADTAHFRLRIPGDCSDTITLVAKLNYRKFSWWNTQWAFAGTRDPSEPHPDVTQNYDDGRWLFTGDLSDVSAQPKRIPEVPTVVIGESSVSVPVVAAYSAPFEESVKLDAADWERWNDYGIGLLLQGDLKGAERAFQNVSRVRPDYADGWVNVARALIQEGNTEAAKPLLKKALELNPNLGSAHYFSGLALKADGEYARAYEEFARAAARYPEDRVNRNQMGRMLFLQRQYQKAIAEYARTLGVDPEDLEAHYNLMLCYRGLGNDDLASREEKLYLRFKANEASLAITGPYKLAHPDDNNEAQPIHEHVSVGLGKSESSKQYAEGRKARSQEPGIRSQKMKVEGRAAGAGTGAPEARRSVAHGARPGS